MVHARRYGERVRAFYPVIGPLNEAPVKQEFLYLPQGEFPRVDKQENNKIFIVDGKAAPAQ